MTTDIEDKCLQLRNEYVSCLKLANETDSKKEDAQLRSEARKALTGLVSICPHNHTVVKNSQYAGSYSMDYDDRKAEARVCLCCGYTEQAYDNEFATLTTTPFIRFEGNYPNQVKDPFRYLLSEAKEAAEKEGYQYFGWRKLT